MKDFTKDDVYYSDTEYVSNSMLGRLMENEVLFDAWMKGKYKYEVTTPMIIGNIVHADYFRYLGSEQERFPVTVVENFDLRTKKGKEYKAELEEKYDMSKDNVIKESDYLNATLLVEQMKNNPALEAYIGELAKRYVFRFEEPFTGEIAGIKMKCKADISCYDFDGELARITDLKTTSNMLGFKGSVRKYGYNRQRHVYAKLGGLDIRSDVFDFAVIEKVSSRFGLFKTDGERFINECANAFNMAIQKYKNWKSGDSLNLVTYKL